MHESKGCRDQIRKEKEIERERGKKLTLDASVKAKIASGKEGTTYKSS